MDASRDAAEEELDLDGEEENGDDYGFEADSVSHPSVAPGRKDDDVISMAGSQRSQRAPKNIEPPPQPSPNEKPRDPKNKCGKKLCRGCAKWMELKDFPANSAFCSTDKKALDNITKQCKDDADKEFVSEARTNPKQCKKMLASYHAAIAVDPVTGRKIKDKGWALAVYKETILAESAVVHTSKGRMMTKTKFKNWARDQGEMTAKEADANWAKWNADPEWIRDSLGSEDGSQSALRLRIPMDDEVDFVSKFSAVKSVEMTGKTIKKPDEAAVASLTKLAVSDHGSLLEVGGFEFNKMGQTLASGSAGPGALSDGTASGAFAGRECVIPNVRDLLADTKEEETSGGTAPGRGKGSKEADSKEDASVAPTEESKKSKGSGSANGGGRYWQGDRALANAQVAAKNQVQIIKTETHNSKQKPTLNAVGLF